MTIVFDIGGSKMRVAKSVDGKTVQDTIILETPKSFAAGYSKLVAQIEVLANGEKITGIAGGIAGLVSNNRLTASINLHDWAHQDFAQKLSQHFDCPVKLENDGAVGALGEALYGAGKGFSSVIYIALGTGVGGNWVVDGKLQNGDGTSEPGHQIIDMHAKQDLEEMIEVNKDQAEREKLMAAGLHNTLMFWPAQIIILGGGKIIHYNWSMENIKKEMENLSPYYKYNYQILKTQLKDEAGLYGALELLR